MKEADISATTAPHLGVVWTSLSAKRRRPRDLPPIPKGVRRAACEAFALGGRLHMTWCMTSWGSEGSVRDTDGRHQLPVRRTVGSGATNHVE